MSLIIVGKMGFAASGIAVASVSGVLLAKWFNPKIEIYGLASSTTSSDLKDKSLKCQFGSSGKKFWCAVEEVIKLTDETKKQVSWKGFVKKTSSTPISAPLNEKKLYKITAYESDLSEKTWHAKEIEIFDVSDSTKAASAGKINAVFKIKETEEIDGKTKQFVGQASSAIAATTAGYKCSWGKTLETNSLKSCSISSFAIGSNPTQDSDTNMSSLTFTSPSTQTSLPHEIKIHHYYLIEFTNHDDTTKDLESFDSETLIYAKDRSILATEQVIFNNLSSVTVVEDQLLILK